MSQSDERNLRLNRLLGGYLEGSLSEEEKQEMLGELEADEGFAREALALHRQGRMLETIFNLRKDSSFVDKTLTCVGYSDNRAAFTDRVWKKTQQIDELHFEAAQTAEASRRRAFRPAWLAAAAAALLLAGGSVALLMKDSGGDSSRPVVARITSLTPGVEVEHAGKMRAAAVGMAIQEGDRIKTGLGRVATLSYRGEATQVQVLESTCIAMEAAGPGKRLRIESGAVRATVSPQPKGMALVITTPHARAEVLGTHFGVTAEEQLTRLNVSQGRVKFTDALNGESIDVNAGFYAKAGANIPFVAKPIPTGTNAVYVAGRVLFREDFDNGLDNWMVVQAAPEGNSKFGPANDRTKEMVRIVSEMQDGKSNAGVVFTLPESPELRIGVQLREKISAPAYAIEWDARMDSYGGDIRPVCPGISDFELVYSTPSLPGIPVKQWYRARMEFTPVPTDGAPNRSRLSSFVNGALTQRFLMNLDQKSFLISAGSGTTRFDRFVIRELVPESP